MRNEGIPQGAVGTGWVPPLDGRGMAGRVMTGLWRSGQDGTGPGPSELVPKPRPPRQTWQASSRGRGVPGSWPVRWDDLPVWWDDFPMSIFVGDQTRLLPLPPGARPGLKAGDCGSCGPAAWPCRWATPGATSLSLRPARPRAPSSYRYGQLRTANSALRSACKELSARAPGYSRHHLATNKNDDFDVRGGPWTPRFARIFAERT